MNRRERCRRISQFHAIFRRPLAGLFALVFTLLILPVRASAERVKVVFDTDISGDVDDCGALAILNALADRGEAEILACVVNGHDADKASVAAVNVINTWYRRESVPIGAYHGTHGTATKSKYTVQLRDEFPHTAPADDKTPEALTVYRRALAGAPDGSVVIISVGFLMNLADLVDSKSDEISPLSGLDLVRKKVRRLVVMGGEFPNPRQYKEYNFSAGNTGADAQHVVENWPTPILFSGFSIGQGIMTGAALEAAPATNPVRRAYELYITYLRNGRSSWDLTAVLAGVRDPEKYWNVIADGSCTVSKTGVSDWSPTPHRGHSYLAPKLDNAEIVRTLETLMVIAPARAAAPVDVGAAAGPTRVPAWNMAGIGPLPWQGISCIHMTGDGRYIAVGTLAPLADPNVLLLDSSGKIVEQHAVGVQSIGEITAFDNGPGIAAVCTAPTGKVYDDPALFRFSAGAQVGKMDAEFLPLLFQYGEHSNHYARAIAATGDGFALTTPRGIRWQGSRAADEPHLIFEYRSQGVRVASFAGNAAGRFVVGTVVTENDSGPKAQNVFVVDDHHPGTTWMRDPKEFKDVELASSLAPAQYGPTTQIEDEPVWAPISVAIDSAGNQVASADVQGFERFVLPRSADEAIKPLRSLCVRFPASRPTIHVYDGQGVLLHKFPAAAFDRPIWPDLTFAAEGKEVLAYPHHWTSRGLAGQPCLPADDDARTLYVLSIQSGNVQPIRFPDAISDVASAGLLTAVGCWNGRVYLLGPDFRPIQSLPDGLDVGAASVLSISADASRIVAGTALGVVYMLDGRGHELWKTDLAKSATPGKKPWAPGVSSRPIAPGIWLNNTGRDPSDAGSQVVIAAPKGLILIDPNSGHSFEQNWAMMKGAGLDPTQVKYVIATHEHGDHAPGAALWRVVTGAKMISTPEMAYTLQHDLPVTSGYSFDPPVPADILVEQDTDMDLCGLKVRLLRLPGHTYGSMGLFFEMGGRRYVCTGDLIMGGGSLGWMGSPNFWPPDVLASLKKLDALKPDYVITGHGHGVADKFIGAGIRAAEATGWGRMPPSHPNPTFGFTNTNYQVVAWRETIYCAATGDIDGDGLPDVAVVTPGDKGLAVKIYLNKHGHFDEKPDHVVNVPGLGPASAISIHHLSPGKIADLLVTTQTRTVFLAVDNNASPAWRIMPIAEFGISDLKSPHEVIFTADRTVQPPQCIVCDRPGQNCRLLRLGSDGAFTNPDGLTLLRPALDLQFADVTGNGRTALITSGGEIFFRDPENRVSGIASITLDHPYGDTTRLAVGDFNGDGKPDIVQLGLSGLHAMAAVFYNTGDPKRPFKTKPDAEIDLGQQLQPLRAGPTVADFTGDGIADLILANPQRQDVLIIPGSKSGLDRKNAIHVKLDYRLNPDTKVAVLDLEGNGKRSIAGFGTSPVGAAGVYIRLGDPPGRN